MTPRQAALRQLLTGELPLDRMGPRLRGAARRAVLSGDASRMGLVGRVIVSELLRRGDLVRVAATDGDAVASGFCLLASTGRRVDLSPLGDHVPDSPEAVQDEDDKAPAFDLDRLVAVMDAAGQLDLQDPQSGETGAILAGILALLRRTVPQVRVFVMLHDPTEVPAGARQLCVADPAETAAGWLALRRPGGAVWIENPAELPVPIRECDAGGTRERRNGDAFPFASAAAVPLHEPADPGDREAAAREIGLLFLVTGEGWSRHASLHLARRLATFVTRRWRNQRDVNRRIHTDGLTGVHNRRYFDLQFLHELERSRRSGEPLTLVLADLDHFKAVNDEHGHDAGDRLLRTVAQGLLDELRRIDHVCRIGGEEFALILPDTSQAAVREVMRRLLDTVFATETVVDAAPRMIRATFSYGVVTAPEAGTDAFELYRKADAMVYLSKDAGRNRCHFWSASDDHELLLPGHETPPA